MKKILGVISILRPHNVLAAFLAVAVGYSMNGRSGFPWILLLAVSAAAAAGNVINDYYDFQIDRINKPRRALPSGLITPRTALSLYFLLLAVLAATFFLLSAFQVIWLICWVLLLHLYSMTLKRKLILGNLAVSILTASGFLLGAYSSGDIRAGIIPSVFTFFFIYAREIVKDCEDMDGDYIFGAETMAIVAGEKRAMRTASIIFFLLAVAFPVPYIAGIYSGAYFVIIIFSVVPILLVSSVLAFRNRGAGLISIILKAGIFFGIIGFYYAVKV
ncbi:MAG: geranylgeranylglycerol-phosphate geranylgeranyltransferase [Candidatus Krumholzibacteriales bacterium]